MAEGETWAKSQADVNVSEMAGQNASCAVANGAKG